MAFDDGKTHELFFSALLFYETYNVKNYLGFRIIREYFYINPINLGFKEDEKYIKFILFLVSLQSNGSFFFFDKRIYDESGNKY